MNIKEIADLFVISVDKIEFYWNFYTVTLIALIGWFVSTKKSLGPRLKLLISAGYLVFVFMNLIGLSSSYTFAEALRQDLLISAKAAPDTLRNAQAVLTERSFEDQKTLAFLIHAILGGFVLLVVWFGRLGEMTSSTDK